MEKVIEKQSLGRYYLQTFANGIKRFTQSKWMVAIVNGFIAVMPIIITASIFTLLSALPEMVMTIIWQKEGPTAWKDHIDYATFEQYQAWAKAISNWSMGIIGLLATAAIAKNLAVELNNKLPFERRMNETAIFFAAICNWIYSWYWWRMKSSIAWPHGSCNFCWWFSSTRYFTWYYHRFNITLCILYFVQKKLND